MKIEYLKKNPKGTYKVCVLMKEDNLSSNKVRMHYLKELKNYVNENDILIVGLKYEGSKVSAKVARDYLLNNVLPIMKKYKVNTMLVADAVYFKFMTGKTSKDVQGDFAKYHLPSMPEYHQMFNVMGLVNYNGYFHNPDSAKLLPILLEPLKNSLENMPIDNKFFATSNFKLPEKLEDIASALEKLIGEPKVAIDIEAFSLQHYEAGIGTISFSKSKQDAVHFFVDYMPEDIWQKHYSHLPIVEEYPDVKAVRVNNYLAKNLIKKYLLLAGKVSDKTIFLYHNAGYDAKVLIYELFMKRRHKNIKGLLLGIKTVLRRFDDTAILAYLANNSCSMFKTDLKSNSIEYMGNYAQGVDVKDITRVDPYTLIEYNGSDTCATYYLEDVKYKGLVEKQKQVYLYHIVFKEACITFMQCELQGMGIDLDEVNKLQNTLTRDNEQLINEMDSSPLISSFSNFNATTKWLKKIKELKVKIPEHKLFMESFNYKSKQLTSLLFDFLGLPVLVTTNKGNASTDKKAIADLEDHLHNIKGYKAEDAKELLGKVKKQGQMATLLSTFLPAFKKYSLKKQKGDEIWYLFGHFKVPATISGRPTSSKPNLLNLPSTGSIYAKPTKKCFKAPKGRLLVGADYASMEHKANALLTGDPNMLAEYIAGTDGHSLRAFQYFENEFPMSFRKKVYYVRKHKSHKKYYKNADGKVFTEDEI